MQGIRGWNNRKICIIMMELSGMPGSSIFNTQGMHCILKVILNRYEIF